MSFFNFRRILGAKTISANNSNLNLLSLPTELIVPILEAILEISPEAFLPLITSSRRLYEIYLNRSTSPDVEKNLKWKAVAAILPRSAYYVARCLAVLESYSCFEERFLDDLRAMSAGDLWWYTTKILEECSIARVPTAMVLSDDGAMFEEVLKALKMLKRFARLLGLELLDYDRNLSTRYPASTNKTFLIMLLSPYVDVKLGTLSRHHFNDFTKVANWPPSFKHEGHKLFELEIQNLIKNRGGQEAHKPEWRWLGPVSVWWKLQDEINEAYTRHKQIPETALGGVWESSTSTGLGYEQHSSCRWRQGRDFGFGERNRFALFLVRNTTVKELLVMLEGNGDESKRLWEIHEKYWEKKREGDVVYVWERFLVPTATLEAAPYRSLEPSRYQRWVQSLNGAAQRMRDRRQGWPTPEEAVKSTYWTVRIAFGLPPGYFSRRLWTGWRRNLRSIGPSSNRRAIDQDRDSI